MIFLRELRRYWWYLQEAYPKEWARYQEEIQRFEELYPQHFRRWDAIRYFLAWQHSIDTKRVPFLQRCPWTAYTLGRLSPAWRRNFERERHALGDKRPWLTFDAIRFLNRVIQRSMRVYEYGTGGSTLFFAQRVREVISVEHDPDWFAIMQASIEEHHYANIQMRLISPQPASDTPVTNNPADPYAYRSSNQIFHNSSFKAYASSIDAYADQTFDIILIDGRARPSCFLHALPKIRAGGYIVWDNTERLHYATGMHLATTQFDFFDFPGPSPYARSFTRTSIWRRISSAKAGRLL